MKNEKTAKTYIEKLGFKDDDLYEKNHDELMEFLVNNKSQLLKCIRLRTGLRHIPGTEKLTLEYCIKNRDYVNGFIDVLLKYKRFGSDENIVFLIEIKTKINSFGAVLRELNYYKSAYLGNYNWIILFSNDDRYRKLFEEQGIMFITEEDINEMEIFFKDWFKGDVNVTHA